MGFKIAASGTNAKIPAALVPLLSGQPGEEAIDAHKIQPFYTGLLAKACGLSVSMTMEGDKAVVAAR